MDKMVLYNLVEKYLSSTCTREERNLIDNWLELLEEDKTFAAYTRSDLDAIHDRIWQKTLAQIYQNVETTKPAPRHLISKTVLRWPFTISIVAVLSDGKTLVSLFGKEFFSHSKQSLPVRCFYSGLFKFFGDFWLQLLSHKIPDTNYLKLKTLVIQKHNNSVNCLPDGSSYFATSVNLERREK